MSTKKPSRRSSLQAPATSATAIAATGSLGALRRVVADGDPDGLEALLRDAQTARRSLPTGAPPAEQLAEVRVQIPDRPG